MRTIKFRVWDTLKEQMICNAQSCFDLFAKDPMRFIFQQTTGLKDKDDVEIWEGDLILSYGRNNNNPCVVIFDDGKFQGKYTEPGSKFTFTLDSGEIRLSRTKVIGNIYENNNLLKETKNA
jgi:uncharacterized phage protein (TIGR01671 family)